MIYILKTIHYFRLMFSETSKKMCLKIYHFDPGKFVSAWHVSMLAWLAWQAALKKTEVKLES